MYPEQLFSCFFFNHPAPTEIYTLSLHDALPISAGDGAAGPHPLDGALEADGATRRDRQRTRLNSSHEWISYDVFCLKQKKYKRFGPVVASRSYEDRHRTVPPQPA